MIRDYGISGGDCFGYFLEKECFDCEYAKSCRYVSETDVDNAHRVRNSVDIDKNEFRGVKLYKTQQNSSEVVKSEFISISDVIEMFGYLAKSDDTTYRMTLEVIRNPNASQSEIARKYGVSRQRIHSAIKEVCSKDPRLASLFCLLMKRNTILNTVDKNCKNEQKLTDNQMELF